MVTPSPYDTIRSDHKATRSIKCNEEFAIQTVQLVRYAYDVQINGRVKMLFAMRLVSRDLEFEGLGIRIL